jgi:hypothetical protein
LRVKSCHQVALVIRENILLTPLFLIDIEDVGSLVFFLGHLNGLEFDLNASIEIEFPIRVMNITVSESYRHSGVLFSLACSAQNVLDLGEKINDDE